MIVDYIVSNYFFTMYNTKSARISEPLSASGTTCKVVQLSSKFSGTGTKFTSRYQ